MEKSVMKTYFAVFGRMVCWGVLGAVCGVCLGLVTGLLHIPSYEVSDPLANEWYPLGVLFTMFCECCGGFLLGAAIAGPIRNPTNRKRVFLTAIVGAILGVVAVRLVPDLGDDALVLSVYGQALGVLVTLSAASLWRVAIKRS
jgi:hypothetical protein